MSNNAQNRHRDGLAPAAWVCDPPETTCEPTVTHAPAVMALKMRAVRALHAGRIVEAEALLQRMLQLEPCSPDARHNLAAIQLQGGHFIEAGVQLRALVRDFPDYGFARIGLAQMCIMGGRLGEAAEWLAPLRARHRVNEQEYAAFLLVEGKLAAAQGELVGARELLTALESIAPDHAGVCELRELTTSVPH